MVRHPTHEKRNLWDRTVDDPLQPAIIANLRSFWHSGTERVKTRLHNEDMVTFHPQGIKDWSFVDRMDEGEDKFLALRHPGAE
jgi:hypothetical protein